VKHASWPWRFLVGLIAALGFTGIAGASFAKVFALIFGVLFLLFLVWD
jgi:uncharacterized membrane protein YtjA (UPF0391 family)